MFAASTPAAIDGAPHDDGSPGSPESPSPTLTSGSVSNNSSTNRLSGITSSSITSSSSSSGTSTIPTTTMITLSRFAPKPTTIPPAHELVAKEEDLPHSLRPFVTKTGNSAVSAADLLWMEWEASVRRNLSSSSSSQSQSLSATSATMSQQHFTKTPIVSTQSTSETMISAQAVSITTSSLPAESQTAPTSSSTQLFKGAPPSIIATTTQSEAAATNINSKKSSSPPQHSNRRAFSSSPRQSSGSARSSSPVPAKASRTSRAHHTRAPSKTSEGSASAFGTTLPSSGSSTNQGRKQSIRSNTLASTPSNSHTKTTRTPSNPRNKKQTSPENAATSTLSSKASQKAPERTKSIPATNHATSTDSKPSKETTNTKSSFLSSHASKANLELHQEPIKQQRRRSLSLTSSQILAANNTSSTTTPLASPGASPAVAAAAAAAVLFHDLLLGSSSTASTTAGTSPTLSAVEARSRSLSSSIRRQAELIQHHPSKHPFENDDDGDTRPMMDGEGGGRIHLSHNHQFRHHHRAQQHQQQQQQRAPPPPYTPTSPSEPTDALSFTTTTTTDPRRPSFDSILEIRRDSVGTFTSGLGSITTSAEGTSLPFEIEGQGDEEEKEQIPLFVPTLSSSLGQPLAVSPSCIPPIIHDESNIVEELVTLEDLCALGGDSAGVVGGGGGDESLLSSKLATTNFATARWVAEVSHQKLSWSEEEVHGDDAADDHDDDDGDAVGIEDEDGGRTNEDVCSEAAFMDARDFVSPVPSPAAQEVASSAFETPKSVQQSKQNPFDEQASVIPKLSPLLTPTPSRHRLFQETFSSGSFPAKKMTNPYFGESNDYFGHIKLPSSLPPTLTHSSSTLIMEPPTRSSSGSLEDSANKDKDLEARIKTALSTGDAILAANAVEMLRIESTETLSEMRSLLEEVKTLPIAEMPPPAAAMESVALPTSSAVAVVDATLVADVRELLEESRLLREQARQDRAEALEMMKRVLLAPDASGGKQRRSGGYLDRQRRIRMATSPEAEEEGDDDSETSSDFGDDADAEESASDDEDQAVKSVTASALREALRRAKAAEARVERLQLEREREQAELAREREKRHVAVRALKAKQQRTKKAVQQMRSWLSAPLP